MKLGKLTRAAAFSEPQVDSDTRTMTFSFSSEYPVERWFGTEVLSHDPGAANLARLNDGAPLLFNHNMDEYIGVVERAWLEGTRGYATVKFSQNERAQQILQDVQDGILRNVSFGYRVNKMAEEDKGSYRVSDWEPLELSLVTVPADPTVGISRSDDGEATDVEVTPLVEPDDEPPAAADNVNEQQETERMETPDVSVIRAEAAEAERTRIASINALGEKFSQPDLARQLIESGRSLDDARAAFLDKMEIRTEPVGRSAHLDLTEKDHKNYSLIRAIRASVTNDWTKAGFELECSREIASRTGRETSGFFVPMELRATYNTGTATQGGNLVATDLLAANFIEILRNRAVVMNLGATMLSGLVGNVDIPKRTGVTSTYWVAEGADITQSEGTFGKISLTPKTVGARSQMTRQMMQQGTPDIEVLVRNDILAQMALALDSAALQGTGSNGQPRGILNQAGINSVVGGTNGAAITFDHIIDLEGSIDVDNALEGSLYYLTNAKVINALKKLKSTTGEYLWNGTDNPLTAGTAGSINGYPVARTNQVPSNLTKGSASGVCSAVVFGNFSDLIVGNWGVLEVLANPYGAGYNSGSVDIRAMQTIDINVRRPESFAVMTDALTSL
jgi:HK97 family phage major capsid protein/HK97 family phage prohead protease